MWILVLGCRDVSTHRVGQDQGYEHKPQNAQVTGFQAVVRVPRWLQGLHALAACLHVQLHPPTPPTHPKADRAPRQLPDMSEDTCSRICSRGGTRLAGRNALLAFVYASQSRSLKTKPLRPWSHMRGGRPHQTEADAPLCMQTCVWGEEQDRSCLSSRKEADFRRPVNATGVGASVESRCGAEPQAPHLYLFYEAYWNDPRRTVTH